MVPNILRSKDNWRMKIGQSMKYDMGNVVLEKSYTKCDRETISRLFSKKSNLNITLDQFIQLPFLVYQFEGYQNKLKLSYGPLVFTLQSFFKKLYSI